MNKNILPKLRKDLYYEVVEEQGIKFIVFFDPSGFCPQPFAVPEDVYPVLSLLDEGLTPDELSSRIELHTGEKPDLNPIIEFISYLDYLFLMDSPRLELVRKEISEYLQSPIRPPVCAGNTYSSEPEELKAEINNLLDSLEDGNIKSGAKAIIVPHIDFRVGENARQTYAAGYSALKNSEADLAVVFGTSHFASKDYFMLTKKHYSTPLGTIETDLEIIETLEKEVPEYVTIDDIVHKSEHSIELQTVLLQSTFGSKPLKILPILVGSFHQILKNNQLPSEIERFNIFLEKLKAIIQRFSRKTIYIASVDFAHIGKKFDDDFDAAEELTALQAEDMELIEVLERCDGDEFFKRVAKTGDNRKICGLSPIYSMLKTISPEQGKFLKYEQWYEKETQSAVSFASIAYY